MKANTYIPKILLVDDLDMNLIALSRLLCTLPVELHQATSGNEGLRLALHHDFALILLDVNMPEMNGYEMASILNEDPKTKHVPIIFVTANDPSEMNKLCGYEVGAVDYLFKPLNHKVLLSKVKSFVELDQNRKALADEVQNRLRLATVMENVGDLVEVTNTAFEITYINAAHERTMGYTLQEVAGKHPFFFQGGSVSSGFYRTIEETISNGDIWRGTLVGQAKDGALYDFDAVCSPVFNDKHELVSYVAIKRDVTERNRVLVELRDHKLHLEELVAARTRELEETNQRLRSEVEERRKTEMQAKESLQEKEALLQEIHHRVKNNLQIIASLLYLQSRKISDPHLTEIFTDSQNRVRSMSLVHETLYQSSHLSRVDFGEYARRLVAQLVQSFRLPRVTIDVGEETACMSINKAIPCGLIVNELVTNAIKHAFPNDRDGRIEVGVSLEGASDRYVLTIRDDGIGLPDNWTSIDHQSLGLKLVSKLVHQIRGELAVESRAGTCFTITFPEEGS